MVQLLIDTSSFLHKAKHTLHSKLSYKEADTGILYGFLLQLGKVCNKYQTNRIVFALDSRKSKRANIYPEYKMNRVSEKTEAEREFDKYCYERFDEVIKVLKEDINFGNIWKVPGYEADDIIAKFILDDKERAKTCVIVSSDNDYYPLLKYCKGMHISKESLYTKRHFYDEWGITADMWKDVKSRSGCKGDNIKSVPGVGYTTAVKYLNGVASKRITELIESEDMQPVIKMARRLTKIPFDNKFDLPEFKEPDLDFDGFLNMCSRFGFNYIVSDTERFRMWEKIINGTFSSKEDRKKERQRKRTQF